MSSCDKQPVWCAARVARTLLCAIRLAELQHSKLCHSERSEAPAETKSRDLAFA
jgi:hypothetical protein